MLILRTVIRSGMYPDVVLLHAEPSLLTRGTSMLEPCPGVVCSRYVPLVLSVLRCGIDGATWGADSSPERGRGSVLVSYACLRGI
eukprot:6398654-Pyramimonas_sp.AAC.1